MNSQKGSTTVEGIIVTSTVMFCVIAIIYIVILFYQLVYIQCVVYKSAVMGSVMVSSGGKDIYIGRVTPNDLDSRGIYRRFYYNVDGKYLEGYAANELSPYNVLNHDSLRVSSNINNYFIYSDLEVKAAKGHIIPNGSLLRVFGLSSVFELGSSMKSTINDPAEFIRNTDFLVDTANEVGGGKLGDMLAKVKASYDKVAGVFR